MGCLYPSHDALVSDDQKLTLRNRGMQNLGRDAIPDRFDLDVNVDMILGRSWTFPKLNGYIQYMSFRHDWGRFPSAETVDLILRRSGGVIPSAAIEGLSELESATDLEAWDHLGSLTSICRVNDPTGI